MDAVAICPYLSTTSSAATKRGGRDPVFWKSKLSRKFARQCSGCSAAYRRSDPEQSDLSDLSDRSDLRWVDFQITSRKTHSACFDTLVFSGPTRPFRTPPMR